MKTVTKTKAVRYILYFYTPGRVLGVVDVFVTHAQYLHHMAVNGQFHALDSVPWGKATLCLQSRRLYLCKSQMCCSYQTRNADLSEPRKNTVLSFINVVITDFRLSGLDLEFFR